MLTLPPEIMTILMPFTQAFSARIWDWAQILLVGAILAPGKRTVTAALRVLGLKDDKQYQNYQTRTQTQERDPLACTCSGVG